MAEFVQQSIEEMLPELEQMERVGLFTPVETRSILKKRKAFEYKLRRRTKQKEDFVQYVEYEINVLALVKKRREKIGYTFKREEIDVAIVQRIHKLFKMACFRFQDDVDLWLTHIEFSKKRGEKASVSKQFSRMLQVHNKKPDLWIMAAKWEMEENVSMDNARSLLQRGLRFNPGAKHMWREYFRMELLNADKLRKRKEILGLAGIKEGDMEVSDAVLEGRVAQVVYHKSAENFTDDLEFYLSFVDITQLFPFAQHIEDSIFEQLQTLYPEHELTWDGLARRPLHRAFKVKHSQMDKKQKGAEIGQLENESWKIYEDAVKKIGTERMWSLYLTACLGRLGEKASKETADKRVSHIANVFSRAAENKLLSEQMYLNWLVVLQKTGQVSEAVRVAEEACQVYPSSTQAWLQRLILLSLGVVQEADLVPLLDKALTTVPEKTSLPLWEVVIKWCALHQPQKMEILLESGLCRCREVCLPIKQQYLEWSAMQGDLRATRALYKRLSSSQPLSVDFFRTYINIEKAKGEVKLKRLRKVYEEAIQEYGSSNPDLWLDYICLEQNHPRGKPENVGSLHWRALKQLDGSLTDNFVTKYTLIQSGHIQQAS